METLTNIMDEGWEMKSAASRILGYSIGILLP